MTLYQCWKGSSRIFLLQLAIGGVFFMLLDSLWVTIVIVAAASLILFGSTWLQKLLTEEAVAGLTQAVFVAVGIAISCYWYPDQSYWWGMSVTAVLSIIVSVLMSFLYSEEREPESWRLRAVALLPAGVGTLLGGAILLCRLYRTVRATVF